MSERKYTTKITDDELSRIIAKRCGLSINAIKEIRRAECDTISDLLKNGYTVKFGNIGKFELKDVAARQSRTMVVPLTGETTTTKYAPPHQRPTFVFNPKIKNDLREITARQVL